MIAAAERVDCRNDVDVGGLRASLLHTKWCQSRSSKNTITPYPRMIQTWQTGEIRMRRLRQVSSNLLTGVTGAKFQLML